MKTVLIIGMGELGKHLAYKLHALKNEVCIVDADKNIIDTLQKDFENAYVGDCMQRSTLEELGVMDFDICVVAVGQNFQASLEITSHLKELGAKRIISKASSDIQAKFLLMAGATETVYPEKDIADKLAVKCSANNLFDYFQISNEYSIIEMLVIDKWVGKSIKELDIRNTYDINIIAIRSGDEVNIPTSGYTFNADDHIFVFGNEKVINKLKKKK